MEDIQIEIGEDIFDIPKKEKFNLILNHLKNKVKDNEFDLSVYTASKNAGNRDINNKTNVSCIIGHSFNIPKFKELGFVLKNNRPYFNGFTDSKAIASFLEIDITDVFYLFNVAFYFNKTNTSLKEGIERLSSYIGKL